MRMIFYDCYYNLLLISRKIKSIIIINCLENYLYQDHTINEHGNTLSFVLVFLLF
jgi:hypothetical protein